MDGIKHKGLLSKDNVDVNKLQFYKHAGTIHEKYAMGKHKDGMKEHSLLKPDTPKRPVINRHIFAVRK